MQETVELCLYNGIIMTTCEDEQDIKGAHKCFRNTKLREIWCELNEDENEYIGR